MVFEGSQRAEGAEGRRLRLNVRECLQRQKTRSSDPRLVRLLPVGGVWKSGSSSSGRPTSWTKTTSLMLTECGTSWTSDDLCSAKTEGKKQRAEGGKAIWV